MTGSGTPLPLARFRVERHDEGYRLEIEDEAGGRLELIASAEQIDVIVEALDDVLAEDDALADEDDEADEDPDEEDADDDDDEDDDDDDDD
ncbi:MAG: hypothetical protein JWL93_2867 [Hyphomicrobiales bacterium]|nr:hypothetical protein [Hyphomicrobiales bacterium]